MAGKANNELISFATLPLAAVVGAFVIAAAISLFVVRHMAVQGHIAALTNQAADSAMFELDERETGILQRMQDAATNKALTQLISSGDKAAIAAEEAELSQLFPDAIRVRLFPLQGASRDMNENPPFSFTSLDMVNKVETNHPVHPEAIKNNGAWILSVAAPIKASANDTVHGTLFAYLNMSVLSADLDKAVNGEVTLVQTYGNLPSNDILTIGQKAPNAPEVTRSLDNPEWRIKFTPSAKIMNAALLSPVLFLLPELVFLLIALAGAVFGVISLLARMNEDAKHLANQMADVIANDYEPSTEYRIKAFADLDTNLSRLGRRAEEKREVTPLDVKLQPKVIPEKERVDVEEIDEDEFEQAMARQRGGGKPAAQEEQPDNALAEIFRAYDIRGIVNETLTPEVIKRIGLAIGSEAAEQGEPTLIVAADGRISSPAVVDALIEGLTESGRDVINIGTVPTPVMYFATHNSETRSGVMVTASHNPPEYNG
ncbi:MAG TPA: hypothetical protein VJ998_11180, partial [Pseudomonadales bacterium]|nr:hypothetical protein [Pseudomonadales bacterium]